MNTIYQVNTAATTREDGDQFVALRDAQQLVSPAYLIQLLQILPLSSSFFFPLYFITLHMVAFGSPGAAIRAQNERRALNNKLAGKVGLV